MRYAKEIVIGKGEADMINKYLHVEPACEGDCLGEDETITHTAVFDNGVEIDIKCCGVQYHEDDTANVAWTEGVLFHNGYECCSEPDDEYFGEWFFEHDGNEYIVVVTISDFY